MAIADEAQQKALWPYGTLNNMGSKDDRFQQMLQQDKEKFLQSILIPQVEPLKIPLIHPEPDVKEEENSSTEKEKGNRNPEKNKNAFWRFLRKCLFFKPKTFWGTQILIPLLSTTVGIFVTTMIQNPKQERKHPHRPAIEHRITPLSTNSVQVSIGTNINSSVKISTEQIMRSLGMFYQLYQSSTTDQNNTFMNQTMICPTCHHSIQVTALPLSLASAKCLTCNQAFQNVSTQRVDMIRQ